MTTGRAKARCITNYYGENPPPSDDIFLHVEHDQVHVGTEVTGKVDYWGPTRLVHIVFEGIESTVVALPNEGSFRNGNVGMEYLHKHTSDRRVLIKQQQTIEMARQQNLPSSSGFRFGLPDDLPGTMRCVLDGSDPTLPSQCQIKYTITASMSNEDGSGKTEVCVHVVVLPKTEVDVPIDPSIVVSIASFSEALYQTWFDCGADLWFCRNDYTDGEEDEAKKPLHDQDPMAITRDNCVLLNASKHKLNLSPGQKLIVDVRDSFQLLRSRRGNSLWMIKLTEELKWRSHGRKAHNLLSWDLYANHHELPTTMSTTYDHDSQSLLHIRHELTIYMTTKDNKAKEILASTPPIPVRIVSSRSGWDA